MKITVFILLIFIVLAFQCGPECDYKCPETIDLGVVPDSIAQKVPYHDKEVYHFKHSAGKLINYTTEKKTITEYVGDDHCCANMYLQHIDKTFLTPDYPIFRIKFLIQNQNYEDDNPIYSITSYIGDSYFYIPINNQDLEHVTFVSNLEIEGNTYTDVYKIKGQSYNNEGIAADSLYYNHEKGILKIKMNNNEYYNIYP